MKLKKLWSVIICASVVLTEIGMTGYTSYAQETAIESEENVAEENNAADDDIADDVENQEEAAGNTAETGQPPAENTAEETEMMGDQANDVQVQSETEEGELKENSWRYSNGEPISNEMYTARAAYPNAWNKVNGRYVNSRGEIIPGALRKGIDVSVHQGKINWEQVKAAGIEFAIIRCGYGMDIASQDDKWWSYNVSECERLGIPYGVYIYSYAMNEERASSEADHVLRLLKGHTLSYPVYFDMEENSMLTLGSDKLGKIAKTFCDKVSAAGYRVGIYSSLDWWNNHLTSSVFKNSTWSKWVAQWNYKCEYKSAYDMWQATEKGSVPGIATNVDVNFWMVQPQDVEPVQVEQSDIIKYSTHMQTFGWQTEVQNGYQSGVTAYSKRMEGIKINVGSGYGDLGVEYESHVQTYGWQKPVTSGMLSGTEGESKRVEAIKIRLTGTEAENYDIYYRTHVQSYGWLDWAKNGEPAGSEGYAKRLEAVQIAVVSKGAQAPGATADAFRKKGADVAYSTHVQTYGWQPEVSEGKVSGTEAKSKRLEGIKISLKNKDVAGSIRYKVHVQTYGWKDWTAEGNVAGTTGESKRLEAICIELTDEMSEKYDIYYRVHSQTYGWLGWAKNGELAGTEGMSKRLEAIQIQLVEKGKTPPEPLGNAFKK